jgi:hypothetical protein
VNTYDLGDEVPIQHKVYDASGALVSATVNVTVTAPDGTTTTPSVTEVSTGIYEATIPTDQSGLWHYRWAISGTVATDYADAYFSVVTTAPPAYASLSDLKASLGIGTDTTRDGLLMAALTGASRAIDRRCGRTFYADTTATARTFRVQGRATRKGCETWVNVDDIATATGVIVELGILGGTTYAATTDYELGPENAPAWGDPYWQVMFPFGLLYGRETRLRVTARWGFPAIPDPVTQATLLYAARLFRRKDSPEGIAGTTEWGAVRVSSRDPDVEALLAPYVIPSFA